MLEKEFLSYLETQDYIAAAAYVEKEKLSTQSLAELLKNVAEPT